MDARVKFWKDSFASSANGFNVALLRHRGRYGYPLHTHKGYCEFVYVLRGHFIHSVNEQRLDHAEGMLFFIRETDCHELAGHNFSLVNIPFNTAWLKDMEAFWKHRGFISALLCHNGPLRAMVPEDTRPQFERTIQKLMAYVTKPDGVIFFSRFLILTLADYFLNYLWKAHGRPSSIPDWMQEVTRWIEESESLERLDVAALVKKCARCPEHVSRSFKKHLGLTPSQYINKCRLQRAAHLLVNTNYPVTEICYSIGYENLSYFHRLFRQAFDLPPRSYRLRFASSSHTHLK